MCFRLVFSCRIFKRKFFVAKHNETGAKGEAIALEHLRAQGYEILATNWRHGHKEIDIVAAKGTELIVVEVKTRAGTGFGFPEEAVTLAKQALLRTAAAEYLEQHSRFTHVRFDIISIVLQGTAVKELLHLTDCFF